MTIELSTWGVINLINFIDMSPFEKEMVLEWRNHTSIRAWMIHQEAISLQAHIAFIESLKKMENRHYFLVKKGEQYIGVVDFTDINMMQHTTECGLYANPIKRVENAGKILLETAIEYAFNILKIEKIYLELFATNTKALKLYERYHFEKSGHKVLDAKEIICMELHSENQ